MAFPSRVFILRPTLVEYLSIFPVFAVFADTNGLTASQFEAGSYQFDINDAA
jgi:hypothetical protein